MKKNREKKLRRQTEKLKIEQSDVEGRRRTMLLTLTRISWNSFSLWLEINKKVNAEASMLFSLLFIANAKIVFFFYFLSSHFTRFLNPFPLRNSLVSLMQTHIPTHSRVSDESWMSSVFLRFSSSSSRIRAKHFLCITHIVDDLPNRSGNGKNKNRKIIIKSRTWNRVHIKVENKTTKTKEDKKKRSNSF